MKSGKSTEPRGIWCDQHTRIQICNWTRRYRSAIERWPAYHLPQHWFTGPQVEGQVMTMAVLYETGFVGRLSLRLQDDTATIGIVVDPRYLGRGIGTAALKLATRSIIFDPFGLHAERARAWIAAENIRSILAFRKAGYTNHSERLWNGHRYIEVICIRSIYLSEISS